ncbi:hypothetical protein L0156_26365 [bacterium]|nr:hypothetical protein [bacterium]
MPDMRKIQYTPEGEQIIFRQLRWGQVIIQSIWVIGVCILLYWSAPAIQAYFERGEITGAARHLERFHLSGRATFAAMLAWCGFLGWWGLGGLYEIAKVFYYRERFLLRSEALIVQRRKLLTREIVLHSYQPMALRLRSADGALEAETKTGAQLLTDGGTIDDRRWLLDILKQRYKTPVDLPAVTANTRERIGTYIVEQRTDGSLRISSSGLSTIGCSVIAGIIAVGLVGLSFRLFTNGSDAGVLSLFFAITFAFIGLAALNRRTVEASRGKLRVKWSGPVGSLIRRIFAKDPRFAKFQFGEGELTSDTGMLAMQTTHKTKASAPSYNLVLLRTYLEEADEEEGVEQEERVREDLVLNVYGAR